jgi:hypothetical protein
MNRPLAPAWSVAVIITVIGWGIWVNSVDSYRRTRDLLDIQAKSVNEILANRDTPQSSPALKQTEQMASTAPERRAQWQVSPGFWLISIGLLLLVPTTVLCARRRGAGPQSTQWVIYAFLVGLGLVALLHEFGWEEWSTPVSVLMGALTIALSGYGAFIAKPAVPA